MSPFRLHRRIGPRPAFLGGDATVKVVGASPFCRTRAEVLPDQACAAINAFSPTNCSEEPKKEGLEDELARILFCACRDTKPDYRGARWQFGQVLWMQEALS